MALVGLVDDGGDDVEWIRLRGPRCTLGRTEGDIVIPHDDAISGRHVELVRTATPGGWVWIVRDLGSRNGTFARVSAAVLTKSFEFIVGSRRFRFDPPAAETVDTAAGGGATRAWQAVTPETAARMVASLVEVTPAGDGRRYPLAEREAWLGADPARATIVVEGDPFVSPRHARVFLDAKSQWRIESARSLNGLWARVSEIPVAGSGEFQIGEQRFLLKVLR